MKAMEWWKTLYNSTDYLDIFSPYITEEVTNQQVDFIINQIPIQKENRILDLCCGTGRHALNFAQRGYKVVGVDRSNIYLDMAHKSALQSGIPIEFIQSDMHDLCLANSFDLVVNMFTSFGYFDDDTDNEKVIHEISKVLKPGGWFFFDFINLPPLLHFPMSTIWHHDDLTNKVIIRDRYIDFFNWHLNETCSIFRDGKKKTYVISYRLYTIAEFKEMLKRHGMAFKQAFGDFDGRDYCNNFPPRMIIISRKEVE